MHTDDKSCARDLDLEHTLDARSPVDHRVQVWSQSSHLSRSRSDLRKKFTDGQTDAALMECANDVFVWRRWVVTSDALIIAKKCTRNAMHQIA